MLETPFAQIKPAHSSTSSVGERHAKNETEKTHGTDFEAEYESSDTLAKPPEPAESLTPKATDDPEKELASETFERKTKADVTEASSITDPKAPTVDTDVAIVQSETLQTESIAPLQPKEPVVGPATNREHIGAKDQNIVDTSAQRALSETKKGLMTTAPDHDSAKPKAEVPNPRAVQPSPLSTKGIPSTVEAAVVSKTTLSAETKLPDTEATLAKPEASPSGAPMSPSSVQTAPVPAATASPVAKMVTAHRGDKPTQDIKALREWTIEQMQFQQSAPSQNVIKPTASQPAGIVAAQSLIQMKLANPSEKIELSNLVTSDLDTPSVFEPRTQASSTTGPLAQVLARSEVPSMVGRQMAEALQKQAGQAVEVSLNPRELGRVKMSISAAEAGITVSVLAERPETLDLMRRNIDDLAREFQAIGYENISFAFSEGHAQHQNGEHEHEPQSGSVQLDLSVDETTQITPQATGISTGVDLRL